MILWGENKKKGKISLHPPTQNQEKKSRPGILIRLSLLFSLFCSLLFHLFFRTPEKGLLFSSLLFSSLSLCHKKKRKMDEEYPNKETEKLFEGVENGDEEVVKVLLLGNKNKQFELDVNFHFKHKVFLFELNFSLSLFSLSLFCCSDVMECEWLCCVIFDFVFVVFLNNFLFVKAWNDRSSHGCFQRF